MTIDFQPDQPQQNTPQIDFQPDQAPISAMQQYLAPFNAGATQFGANILGDIGRLTGNRPFANQMNQLAQNAPQIYGAPNNTTAHVIEGISQAAPYGAFGAAAGGLIPTSQYLSRIPYIGSALGPIAQQSAQLGGLYGATQSQPGQALKGTLENAAISYAIPGAGGLAKSGYGLFTGKAFQNAANNLYQGLSKGQNADVMNKNIVDQAINNYKNIMTNPETGFNARYNNFKNLVSNNGYATSGRPPIAGLGEPTEKFMNVSNDTRNAINAIPQKDSDIYQQITSRINSPTFNNFHDLQSKIGEAAADYGSGNADQASLAMQRALKNVRDSLKGDINSSFIKNGDTHLAQDYQQLGQDYLNNAVPYQEVPTIWRSIQGGKYPSNIINTLKEDDNEGNIETIRNHLAANPDIQRQVVAQALAKDAPQQFGEGQQVKLNNFFNRYANLPQNIKNMAPPDLEQNLNNIYSKSKWFGKLKNTGFGTALGAAGLEAYHKAREYL